MFGYLNSWFLILLSLWISWTEIQYCLTWDFLSVSDLFTTAKRERVIPWPNREIRHRRRRRKRRTRGWEGRAGDDAIGARPPPCCKARERKCSWLSGTKRNKLGSVCFFYSWFLILWQIFQWRAFEKTRNWPPIPWSISHFLGVSVL